MHSAVEHLIRQRLLEQGPVSFAEVMRLALYDPAHGYYGQGPPHLGRGGDFFTSVSVGPLFGRLLAIQAQAVWEGAGRPAGFALIEQGAHDGQLMADIHLGLREMGSPLADTAGFIIIEPVASYREAQAARLLPELRDRLEWRDSIAALAAARLPEAAFFYCNELLDAFPAHLLHWTGSEWRERGVALAGDILAFTDLMLLVEPLRELIPPMATDSLVPGHEIEVCPSAIHWLRDLAAAMPPGAVFIADYGLDDAEWFSPERQHGTIRRYRQHQMDGRVLEDLGECDLTAHVSLGALKRQAAACGLRVSADESQGRFLTRLAADWLLALENEHPDPSRQPWIRQFHTLTHPAHLGGKFHVLLLEKPRPGAPA